MLHTIPEQALRGMARERGISDYSLHNRHEHDLTSVAHSTVALSMTSLRREFKTSRLIDFQIVPHDIQMRTCIITNFTSARSRREIELKWNLRRLNYSKWSKRSTSPKHKIRSNDCSIGVGDTSAWRTSLTWRRDATSACTTLLKQLFHDLGQISLSARAGTRTSLQIQITKHLVIGRKWI